MAVPTNKILERAAGEGKVMNPEYSVSVRYVYHQGRGFIPHIAVVVYHPSDEALQVFSDDTQQEVKGEHGGVQRAARFIQEGNREVVTAISGGKVFRVEQVKGEPFLLVYEHTLPVTLRLNGFLFDSIASARGYHYYREEEPSSPLTSHVVSGR